MALNFDLELDLDIETLTIDPALLARVPEDLAVYYLSLPVAREDSTVSVLTAYPDNVTAHAELGRRLSAQVLPVPAAEPTVRRAIARAYDNGKERAMRVGDAFRSPAAVRGLARHSSGPLHFPVRPVESLPELDRTGALRIAAMPCAQQLPELLAQSEQPLLLVGSAPVCLRRMLIVLRGYASDAAVLDWSIPLARSSRAMVSVLVLSPWSRLERHGLLSHQGPAQAHLTTCMRRLDESQVRARLVLRQGDAKGQLVNELAQNRYDLFAIAAEGQGAFVAELLDAVQQQQVHERRPVLVIKPPTTGG